ncbi:hypothetical protein [Bowmanella denitrificans]|uniref:hypothetical protein n=1 Tax=Bowmanella denitrificans TaxID=366582 RepID=UPI000C9B70FF|nr:hypothetical protein [Bowmanella denitrificans]
MPILLLLLLFSPFLSAQMTQTDMDYIWITPDPPGKTHKNINELGTKTATFHLLADAAPDKSYFVLIANTSRAIQMLEEMDNACAGNKVRSSDRVDKFPVTRLPQTLFPGLHLYVNKRNKLADQLTQIQQDKGTIHITDVLELVGEKQFGLVGGRSYGDQLDSQFKQPKWQTKFWTRTSADMAAGMLDMLLQGRVSAVMEYPNSAFHYSRQLDLDQDLISFKVAEAPQQAQGFIFCSNSAKGRSLVAFFDTLISRVSKQRAYLDAHLNWMPSMDKQHFIEFYNQVYGTAFQLSDSTN